MGQNMAKLLSVVCMRNDILIHKRKTFVYKVQHFIGFPCIAFLGTL